MSTARLHDDDRDQGRDHDETGMLSESKGGQLDIDDADQDPSTGSGAKPPKRSVYVAPDLLPHDTCLPVDLPDMGWLLCAPKGSIHSNKMSCTPPEPLEIQCETIENIPLVNPVTSESAEQIDMKKWRDGPVKPDLYTSESKCKLEQSDEELMLSDDGNK
jgi:hypothetical protein